MHWRLPTPTGPARQMASRTRHRPADARSLGSIATALPKRHQRRSRPRKRLSRAAGLDGGPNLPVAERLETPARGHVPPEGLQIAHGIANLPQRRPAFGNQARDGLRMSRDNDFLTLRNTVEKF